MNTTLANDSDGLVI